MAGGPGESVVQPLWSDAGLSFVSDRTDWWNIYTETSPGQVRSAIPRQDANTAGSSKSSSCSCALLDEATRQWRAALLSRAEPCLGATSYIETRKGQCRFKHWNRCLACHR